MDWKAAIGEYKAYLKLERGLSQNTLEAYLHDVEMLHSWVRMRDENKKPIDLVINDLKAFLQEMAEMGLKPTSQARLLSGLKGFYKFFHFKSMD